MSANWSNWKEFVEEFCGSDFWYNESYYENSTLPNFTPCFQYTVLVGSPALLFFILSPIFTFQLEWLAKRYELLPFPRTFLRSFKSFLTLILFVSSLAIFVRYLVSWDISEGQVFFWYPLLRFQTSACLTHCQSRLRRFGYSSNGIIFNSTLVLFICSIPEARSWIERILNNELEKPLDLWAFIMFWIWFGALSLYFLCLLGAEKRSNEEALNVLENPELNHSFVNYICLKWLSPLVWAKNLIRKNDLFNVNKLHESLNLYKSWNKVWIPKFKKYQQNSTGTQPSIADTLFTIFKWELIAVGALRLIADFLQFTTPILLYLFILFLDNNERLWKGISISILLFITLQIRSFMLNYCSMVCEKVGIQVRTTLQTVIYKKTLRLTKNSLETQTDKQLENLLNSDVKAFEELFKNIHLFWSPILQIGLSFIVLFYLLHVVSLPIMAYVLLTIIANLCLLVDEHQYIVNSKHLRLLNEALRFIRTIKMKVWEIPVQRLLKNYRENEADLKIYPNLLRLLADTTPLITPYLLVLIAIIGSIVLKVEVQPIKLFISIYLVYQICGPISELRLFSQIVYELLPANIRLRQYLLGEQIDRKIDNHNFDSNDDVIQIENAYFSNDYQIPLPTFLDVNLSVQKGQLVAIIGEDQDQCRRFLRVMTNELKKLDGYVKINGSLSYVENDPWLMNASILENIKLLADKHQKQLYNQIVEKCRLYDILNVELRNKGQNENLNEILTQSQKIRVSLARAIYNQSEILLLEDIFAHLDTLMARQIFTEVINDLLKDKTRLFVTNNLDYAKQSDYVIFINGSNLVSGAFPQLIATNPDFDVFTRNLELHQSNEEPTIDSTSLFPTNKQVKINKAAKSRVTWEDIDGEEAFDERDSSPLIHTPILNRQEFTIYWHFFKSLGMVNNLFSIFAIPILLISLQSIQNVWFADWIDKDWEENDNFNGHYSLQTRLGIFIIVGTLQLLLFVSASYLLAITFVKMSSKIYEKTTGQILNAKIEFFNPDTINKLANIFNKDLQLFDSSTPRSLNLLTFSFVYVMVILLFSFVVNPLTIIFTLFIGAIFGCLISAYIKKSRQLVNMKRNNEQLIVSNLIETHKLIQTIRVFNRSLNFAWKNDDLLDLYVKFNENQVFFKHWTQIRVWTCANGLIFSSTLSILFLHYWGFELSTNWIAMSLALILNLPFFVQELLRELNELATNTISTDKLKTFDAIEPEISIANTPLADDFPNRGQLRFENISTYKQPDSNSFLQNLTFEIDPAQKVVLVGDDSSGKDAILDLIFHLNDPVGGQIQIDEVALSSINVKVLRQRLAVIPEKISIFNETIRFNLDPTGNSTDDQLWNALKAVHLDAIITNKWADGLSHQIDVEDDLSTHQKWLFELARIMLKPSKVVLIEEPIGVVEDSTAESIMEILRRDCADSTILIIASNFKSTLHRDFPVLLLENGELKGFDLPHKLIADVPTTSSQAS